MHHRKRFVTFLFALSAVTAGCGFTSPTQFPHSVLAPDGEPILLDDVLDILEDPQLNDDEKKEALRDLGLEDEKLINALLEA